MGLWATYDFWHSSLRTTRIVREPNLSLEIVTLQFSQVDFRGVAPLYCSIILITHINAQIKTALQQWKIP